MKQTKYIFVTGGVVSGLGKGITAASLGRLLKSRGLKVSSKEHGKQRNGLNKIAQTARNGQRRSVRSGRVSIRL